MPEIIADSRPRSCYHLFSGSGILEFQRLAPDLFASRAHARELFKAGRPAKSAAVRGNPNLGPADSIESVIVYAHCPKIALPIGINV
jgi:hypothetical protein